MNLNATLSTALQGLQASTAGIQVTNKNIANANTPGYSRESVILTAAATSTSGINGGVTVEGYQSVRSELLQMQILQQTQQQSSANAQLNTLNQVQTVFNSSTSDIGSRMSALFTSLSSLSTDPSNTTLRQAVLTAGGNLATSFNQASKTLTSLQTSLNTQVSKDVDQINKISTQIAALNPQINAAKATGQDAGSLLDQQDQLLQNLSQLTGVSITQSDNGITVTTGNGTPLVVGPNSYPLNTTTGSDGSVYVLDSNGQAVNAMLQDGDLGGILKTRDQSIPALQDKLDTLASQVATAFNTVQAQGFDATGAAGSKFFNIPANTPGTAANITFAIKNPSQVAASSDTASGSNGNLANFAAIQTTNLPSGQNPTQAYATLVYDVGSLTAAANAQASATTASLQQLNDQRASVSGVSIDEESTNLIRYQQAYQAAAKVVSTVNDLFTVTMNMI